MLMSDRPVLGDASPAARLTTIAATFASITLVVLHVFQLRDAGLGLVHVWLVPVAWIAADLFSGLVHWSADTWGSESTPVLGSRFIRPFRVHHINPSDITTRPFFDLNGDVALGVLPILAIAFATPPSLRFFLVALAVSVLPTNQIHQWAHRETVPRPVRALQRWGIILRPEQHQLHHTEPFRSHYCITSGWWNGLLGRTRILKRLEDRRPRRA